jgi:hypothetical protein
LLPERSLSAGIIDENDVDDFHKFSEDWFSKIQGHQGECDGS